MTRAVPGTGPNQKKLGSWVIQKVKAQLGRIREGFLVEGMFELTTDERTGVFRLYKGVKMGSVHTDHGLSGLKSVKQTHTERELGHGRDTETGRKEARRETHVEKDMETKIQGEQRDPERPRNGKTETETEKQTAE